MISRIGFNGRGALLVAGLLVAMSGCGSTTVIEEAAINGLDVVQSGQIIVAVRAGHVQGSLLVEVDVAAPTLSVTFMNEDGQVVSVSGRSMDAQIANEVFATFTQTSPGAFTGTLTGISDGSTTIVFRLVQGTTGTGQVLYTSPSISIEVLGEPS
jgi:hypothetical protein